MAFGTAKVSYLPIRRCFDFSSKVAHYRLTVKAFCRKKTAWRFKASAQKKSDVLIKIPRVAFEEFVEMIRCYSTRKAQLSDSTLNNPNSLNFFRVIQKNFSTKSRQNVLNTRFEKGVLSI